MRSVEELGIIILRAGRDPELNSPSAYLLHIIYCGRSVSHPKQKTPCYDLCNEALTVGSVAIKVKEDYVANGC